jgi:hypothetical protein
VTNDAIRVDVAAVQRLSLRARFRLALRLLRVLFPAPAPASRIFAGVSAATRQPLGQRRHCAPRFDSSDAGQVGTGRP